MDLRDVSKRLKSFFQRLCFDFGRKIANKNVIVFCQEKLYRLKITRLLWLVCSLCVQCHCEELKWKVFLFLSLKLSVAFYRIKSWIFKDFRERVRKRISNGHFSRWIAAVLLLVMYVWQNHRIKILCSNASN